MGALDERDTPTRTRECPRERATTLPGADHYRVELLQSREPVREVISTRPRPPE
jgi:hypothetical protein